MVQEEKPFWVSLSKTLAPWAAIIVFSAPYPTIQKCVRDRTVGSLPLLPYSSMIVSAFLWISYGFLIKEKSVWQTNMVGLCMAVYYFIRFAKCAPPKSPTLPGSVRQHATAILVVVWSTVAIIHVLPIQDPKSAVGNIAVCFCVAMFASPLSALRTVLKTKNAKSIPLPFTIATIINCVLWSVVGLDLDDFNIYFPNLLGLSFGLAQLSLMLIFGNGAHAKAQSELDLVI